MFRSELEPAQIDKPLQSWPVVVRGSAQSPEPLLLRTSDTMMLHGLAALETSSAAIVDCTVFGSASNCVLFCEDGIYFHNGWESESPGAHHVAYADMAHAEGGGYHEVAVGQGKSINVAGCALSVEELSTILNAVRNA